MLDDSGTVDSLDCETCSFDERQSRGCETPGDGVDFVFGYEVETLDICPIRWLSGHAGELAAWNYYCHYANKGIMPKSGGVDDQPAVIMKAISILSKESARIERLEIEFQRDKGKHPQEDS